MLAELQDIAAGIEGSKGVISVKKDHLDFIKDNGGGPFKGRKLEMGSLEVACPDFCKAVSKVVTAAAKGGAPKEAEAPAETEESGDKK